MSPHQFKVLTLGGCDTIFFGIKTLFNLHLDWVVMQVDVENVLNNVSQVVIFRELQNAKGLLVSIVPFTRMFYGVHSFLFYQHGQHEKGVLIIESYLSTRQDDPLKGLLFALAHYRTLLKTITQAFRCVFPSLTNDTHIEGPLSKIIPTFDHLLTINLSWA